jgi:hypothetical protein
LLSRERPASDTCRVRLDNADDLSNTTWRDTEAGTYPTYSCRAARHVRIRAIVDVEHQRIRAFDKDAFAGRERLVYVHNAVDDERPQPLRQSLQGRVLKGVDVRLTGRGWGEGTTRRAWKARVGARSKPRTL